MSNMGDGAWSTLGIRIVSFVESLELSHFGERFGGGALVLVVVEWVKSFGSLALLIGFPLFNLLG